MYAFTPLQKLSIRRRVAGSFAANQFACCTPKRLKPSARLTTSSYVAPEPVHVPQVVARHLVALCEPQVTRARRADVRHAAVIAPHVDRPHQRRDAVGAVGRRSVLAARGQQQNHEEQPALRDAEFRL